MPINASPENKAYNEAKSFAALVDNGSTGPIPPRIIDAFRSESIQFK